MNHIYRVVWNTALGTYTVVSELARSHRPRLSKLSVALLLGLAVQGHGMATDYTVPVVTDNGSDVLLDGDTVTVSDPADFMALGAYRPGSRLIANDVTALTTGDGLWGAYVGLGGQMTLTGGSVTTQGDVAYGVMALSTGARFTATDTSIRTSGINAFGVVVLDGAAVELTGGSVTTTGEAAVAVMAAGNGTAMLEGTTVTTQGTNSLGLYAFDAGHLNASHVAVDTAGNYAYGLAAETGGFLSFTDGSITMQGGAAYGVVAQDTGTEVIVRNTAVGTTGEASLGVLAGYGASVELIGGSVTTTGDVSDAIQAVNGGTVTLDGTQVRTQGDNSSGVTAYYANTQITAMNTTISTTGAGSYGIWMYGGASIELIGGSVTTTGDTADAVVAWEGSTVTLDGTQLSTQGDGAYGVWALDGAYHTQVTATDVTINTTGASSHGVMASEGASVGIAGGGISTSGENTVAVLAMDTGTQVTLRDTSIAVQGDSGGGIYAIYGAAADISGGSIDTFGLISPGVTVQGDGSQLALANATVTTHGEGSIGLAAIVGGVVETSGNIISTLGEGSHGVLAAQPITGSTTIRMSGDSISTQGDGAIGLYAYGTGAAIDASNVRVQTSGAEEASVIGAYGVDAEAGGRVTLRNGTSVSTSGTGAMALLAIDSGSEVTTSGMVTARTTGDRAYGALAQDGGTITLAQGASIDTNGDAAHGLVSLGADSQINATGATVVTHGAQTSGIALGNSTINLVDSSVVGQYTAALLSTDGMNPTASTLNVSGGSLASVVDDAIHANAGSNGVNLSHGARVTGGNGVLLRVATAGTAVDLVAADHVVLEGDVIAVGGSTANVSLAQASTLTGAARNVAHVDVDATSQWNLTASSDVRQLALGGIVAFSAPVSSYKTLTVHGDWIGNGGTVVLNTQLNEGGPLSNQFTDRVLVEGNASGTTYLAVTGSGTGAVTDANRNGVLEPYEGISLAQVAGQASASAFRLAGGYVAVGPWRYELHDYQPGSADAGQRVVAGSGNGYWDYRLQNAYVADPNPTNPTDPTNPIDPADPTGTQRPAVVPQVPSYLAASTAMLAYGLRSLGTLHDRLGEIHNDAKSTDSQSGEFYARVFGGDYRYGSNRSFAQYGYDFDQNDRGVQIGGTWLKAMGDTSTWRLGAYGVTGTSRITPHAVDGSSRMRMTGNSLGLTGTYEQASGLYIDGVVARNFYRTSVDTAERGHDMAQFRTRGWSYSLETGMPFVFGDGIRLEPQAQVIYQSLHTASFTDRDGLTVSPASSNAWTGRVGTYLSKTFTTDAGGRWTPWVRLNYVASGNDGDDVQLRSDAWGVSDTLVSGKPGRAVQLGAGITGAWSNALSVYGGADYQARVGDVGERGWSANLGLRWRF